MLANLATTAGMALASQKVSGQLPAGEQKPDIDRLKAELEALMAVVRKQP